MAKARVLGDRPGIKDKLMGRIYTIESIENGRYGCDDEDGSLTSIPFADALTDLDPDNS